MRVLANIVVRNEAQRYWDSWLDWHVPLFGAENVHVWDDHSDDDEQTLGMAIDAGASVSADDHAPRFLEHEGRCRQRAWNAMEAALKPEPGDWVFCLDADEFLVGRSDERNLLYHACDWANVNGRTALMVSIPEVFRTDLQDDGLLTRPMVRLDGWWGRIAGTRLFAWQPGGQFSERAMASGSEPTYVGVAPRSTLTGLWLLHYGYARPEDVYDKYERYLSRGGHADAHVASIVTDPVLAPWDGPTINVYLGRRPEPGPGDVIELPKTSIVKE